MNKATQNLEVVSSLELLNMVYILGFRVHFAVSVTASVV
jgi:hypothetical protein